MANVITGVFERPSDASAAVDELLDIGVDAGAISVVATDPVAKESFAIEDKSKVGEGAAIGAGMGGGIGALIAGFTAVGTLATTGIGLVAAGPLVAALAGAGAGAAGGGLIGALVGLGIPEHEVKFYQDALGRGAVLVGVDADRAERKTVEQVFERHEAASRPGA